MATGPPKALEAPKPVSSSSTTSTLGAPAGGLSGVMGGNEVSGSFASNVVRPTGGRPGIGNTSRWIWSRCSLISHHSQKVKANRRGAASLPAPSTAR